jgi:hypothetical protein
MSLSLGSPVFNRNGFLLARPIRESAVFWSD